MWSKNLSGHLGILATTIPLLYSALCCWSWNCSKHISPFQAVSLLASACDEQDRRGRDWKDSSCISLAPCSVSIASATALHSVAAVCPKHLLFFNNPSSNFITPPHMSETVFGTLLWALRVQSQARQHQTGRFWYQLHLAPSNFQ
jgi:hypothetical protein